MRNQITMETIEYKIFHVKYQNLELNPCFMFLHLSEYFHCQTESLNFFFYFFQEFLDRSSWYLNWETSMH